MENLWIVFVSGLALGVVNYFSWGYLNRQRGAGDKKRDGWLNAIGGKTAAICAMGLITSIHTNLVICLLHDWHWGWNIAFTFAEVLAVNILFRPSWGEIFPDTNDTFHEEFAFGVKRITNVITGYDYTAEVAQNDDKELFWKTVAWTARFGLFGVPFAVLKCVASISVLPLVVWVFGAAFVGFIYRRNRYAVIDGDWVAKAEKQAGSFVGAKSAIMLLP